MKTLDSSDPRPKTAEIWISRASEFSFDFND
jgi:hypothetical protein